MSTNEYIAYFLLRQRFCDPENRGVWNRAKLIQDLLCKEFATKKELFLDALS